MALWGGAKEESGQGMCRALLGAGLRAGVEWRCVPPIPQAGWWGCEMRGNGERGFCKRSLFVLE